MRTRLSSVFCCGFFWMELWLLPCSAVSSWKKGIGRGEDRGEKGYLLMTTDWFKEFVFEIVVDKKFCSQEVLDVFKLEPKVLPAWDPMGALARN